MALSINELQDLIYVVTNAEHFEHLVQQLGTLPPEKLLPNQANDVVILKLGEDFKPESRVMGGPPSTPK